MNPWIVGCRDEVHAATECARIILDSRVRECDARFALALSGGRIAPILYDQLVSQSKRRGIADLLAATDFFWADERCVAPEHGESNYRVARVRLLAPLEVVPSRVHRLEGERPPPEAAERATADWERWRAESPRSPALTCAILGVGEDGHVASLFPGNIAADSARHEPFCAVTGPKPPPDRITMSYPMLCEAGQVLVLVTGAGKDEVVERSLSGRLDTPLARVIAGRGDRETVLIRVRPNR